MKPLNFYIKITEIMTSSTNSYSFTISDLSDLITTRVTLLHSH